MEQNTIPEAPNPCFTEAVQCFHSAAHEINHRHRKTAAEATPAQGAPNRLTFGTMDEQLKAELLRIAGLIAPKQAESEPWSKLAWKFLNSTFFVSVFAATTLALLSRHLEQSASKAREEREAQQATIAHRRALIRDFALSHDRWIEFTIGMRKREIWLSRAQYLDKVMLEDAHYPDSRNFVETRDFYETDKRFFLQYCGTSPVFILPALEAEFKSPACTEAVDKYRRALSIYTTTTEFAVLKTQLALLQSLGDDLIKQLNHYQ